MSEFEWPWQYNFPPFFTIQPTVATKAKQFEAWKNLILSYHRAHRLYVLDMTEVQNSPLFCNKAIGRKLAPEALRLILEDMRQRGYVEWTDKQQNRCFIFWRTPQEWAKLIYDWANANGMTNTVCTFYELTNDNEQFNGLDTAVLRKAIQVLEDDGKAEFMAYDGSEGVKFF